MKNKIEPIKIGKRLVGPGQPVFIIAEIGINHNGSVTRAKKLIDLAKNTGADAVKFQKRCLKDIYTEGLLKDPNKGEQSLQYMLPELKRAELSNSEFRQISTYAKKKEIIFFATPWDKKSTDDLEGLGVSVYKIGSPDMTNSPLLEYIAKKKKPMLVSTGMSEMNEVRKAVKLLKKLGAKFALLHCNSTYPSPIDQLNLRFINTLQREFKVPVGYSSHELDPVFSALAVALGANITEKHFTIDRSLPGPDHKASLTPDEFLQMVRYIRETEKALGTGKKYFSRGEILNREVLAKSIYTKDRIRRGQKFTKNALTVKGPAKGYSPQDLDRLIGKRAWRNFKEDELIPEKPFQPPKKVNLKTDWIWGIKGRFPDLNDLAPYNPRVFEFHFTNEDVDTRFQPRQKCPFRMLVHAPEYIGHKMMDLCAPDKKQREASIKLIQKTVNKTIELARFFKGTPAVVLHPGGMSISDLSCKKKELYKNCANSLKKINFRGIEVYLENLPPKPWYFGGQWTQYAFADAEELYNFAKEQGHYICFDLAHAKLYCNLTGVELTKFAKILKPLTKHLHISDAYGIDGEGVQIDTGEINFKKVFKVLGKKKYSFIPEIWRGHLNNNKGYFVALERLQRYLPK